jgi:hypothetical protein
MKDAQLNRPTRRVEKMREAKRPPVGMLVNYAYASREAHVWSSNVRKMQTAELVDQNLLRSSFE